MAKYNLEMPDEIRAGLDEILQPGETRAQVILEGLRQVIAERKRQAMAADLAAKIQELEERINQLEQLYHSPA